jgi:cell division protease FtsH
MDRVKKVDLYENGTIAIVEAVSPELGNRVQRVRVQLPGTSQVSHDQEIHVKLTLPHV